MACHKESKKEGYEQKYRFLTLKARRIGNDVLNGVYSQILDTGRV
jgi:hypothetical protein